MLDFAQRLAELGCSGDMRIQLPGRGWAALNGSRYTVVLYTPTGRLEVLPLEPRDTKCPHGVPWDYCNECIEGKP